MIPSTEGALPAGEPIPVQWTAAAEARLASIPAFVAHGADRHREIRPRAGAVEWTKILDAARDFFGM